MFSVANGLLLRPVPGVADPDRLVMIEFSEFREAVGGDDFGVPGVRAELGRVLNPAESGPGRPTYVAVISSRLWRQRFGGDRSVIGEVVRMNRHPITIVGVAQAVRLRARIRPHRDDALVSRVRSCGADRRCGRHLSEERLFARLMVVLASIALLMVSVGLYCVVAGSVAERTREIGIRMALGARRRRVLAMVLKQAGTLVVTGTVLGVSGAVVLTRVIENQLFGVDRLDPAIYAAAAALFALVALAATAVPARRASGVDPMLALRHE